MSDFRNGLVITAIPIIFLSGLELTYVFTRILWVFWIAAIVYCVAVMVLALVFFAITGKRMLATGMLTGNTIGAFAILFSFALFSMD